MTPRDLYKEISFTIGKEQTQLLDAVLTLVNKAQIQLALDLDIFNSESGKNSVIDINYVEMPLDTIEVVKVYWDNYELPKYSYAELRGHYETSDTPAGWAILYEGAKILVYLAPPPDEVERLTFIRKVAPTELTSLDQTISLPIWSQRALTHYLNYLVYDSLVDPRKNEELILYNQEVQKCNKNYGGIPRYERGREIEIEFQEDEP